MKYNITHLKKTTSTNDFLKRRCGSLSSFSIAIADTQTAGRGRFRRRWKSEKGGLWFSILVKHRSPDKSFLLGFGAAVCIALVLRSRCIEADIKWPNDVTVKGKKICGMLIENVIVGDMTHTIVGIGVNLNNKKPISTATTVELETGKQCSIDGFFKSFLDCYRKTLYRYSQKRYDIILDEWKGLWIAQGQKLNVKTMKGVIEGIAHGVDNDGQLILKKGRKNIVITEGDIS